MGLCLSCDRDGHHSSHHSRHHGNHNKHHKKYKSCQNYQYPEQYVRSNNQLEYNYNGYQNDCNNVIHTNQCNQIDQYYGGSYDGNYPYRYVILNPNTKQYSASTNPPPYNPESFV
jgi:hypothetical protein